MAIRRSQALEVYVDNTLYYEKESLVGDESGSEIMWLFMGDLYGQNHDLAQAETVPSFCENETLADLRSGTGPAASGPAGTAWLIERSVVGGTVLNRPSRGPLSASQLYQALCVKRYRSHPQQRPTLSTDWDTCSTLTNAPETEEEPAIDAHQRLLFVRDATPSALLAIATTATSSQKAALRSMMSSHLQGGSSIQINVEYQICFQLEAHISYPVWRDSREPLADTRLSGCWKDAEPLRQYRNASWLLRREDEGPKAFIYDTKVSILSAGESEQTWVAYVFEDAYWQERSQRRDPHEEDVVEDAGETVPAGLLPDPLLDPNQGDQARPLIRPQEYWVRVVSYHVEIAVKEWTNVLFRLRGGFREFTTRAQSEERRKRSPQEQFNARKAQKDWANTTEGLLAWLMPMLHDLLRALQNLHSYWADIVEGFDRRALGWVASLRKSVRELREIGEKLLTLREELKAFSHQLKRNLQLAGQESSNNRERQGDQNKWMMISTYVFFVPLGLVAQVFSTAGVLPFPATFRNFMISTGVMTVCVAAVILWATFGIWSSFLGLLGTFGRKKDRQDAIRGLTA